MKKRRLVAFGLAVCLFAALLLAGCPPPLKQSFEPARSIPEGKALVYAYRPGKAYDTGLEYYVLEANGAKVARMYPGGYYPYFCKPGRIQFTSQTDQVGRVVADIEANQTYYLKLYVAEGNTAGVPKLEMVSPETGMAELSTCKLIVDKKEAGY